MKLDFSALAKNINNQSSNDLMNNFKKQLHQNNQFNEMKINNNNTLKLRRSQLNDQSSIMLKTSALESYFFNYKEDQSIVEDNKEEKVNLSVMYPYEISKQLNVLNIDQKISQMKNEGIFNESALKFIKKQVLKDISKSKSKSKQNHISTSTKKNSLINQLNKSTQLQKKSKNNTKKTNLQNYDQNQLVSNEFHSVDNSFDYQSKFIDLESHQNNIDNDAQNQQNNQDGQSSFPLNTLLFKHFTNQDSKQKKTKKNNANLQKSNEKLNYMRSIYVSPKNRNNQEKKIPTDSIKLQKELKQLRSRPSLQLTQNSPFTQKVVSTRQSKRNNNKANVFDSLHNEAYFRQCKKSLQEKQIQKNIQENINKKKTLESNQSKRYKVNSSFYERLQRSIQKKYNNNELKKKYSVNPSTGYPLFKPDTTLSKQSYQVLFHKSTQKQKTQKQEQIQNSIKTLKKINTKPTKNLQSNQQSQRASTTNYSYKKTSRSIKETKQNSLQKIQKSIPDDQTTGRRMANLQSNLYVTQSSLKSEYKSKQIIDYRNQKLVEKMIQIFYPSSSSTSKSNSNEIKLQEQDNFNKTYETISCLSEQQYAILSPLLNQIEQIQRQTSVTSLMFKNLFLQFFKKLSFYDQLILRQPLELQRKKGKTIGLTHAKQFIDSLAKSRKREVQNKTQAYTYRPAINYISASMEKINQKYEDQLYYV